MYIGSYVINKVVLDKLQINKFSKFLKVILDSKIIKYNERVIIPTSYLIPYTAIFAITLKQGPYVFGQTELKSQYTYYGS